jgi:hypothetical protein
MRRVFLTMVVAACALLGAESRASAMTELCPAFASPLHALDAAPTPDSGADRPAALYSYELDALSGSEVTGTLAVETDKGWYTAPFGPAKLAEHMETFADNGMGVEYTRRNFFSDPLYIRFERPLVAMAAFVLSATSDDSSFTWPKKGEVSCDDAGAPILFSLAQDPFAAFIASSVPHAVLVSSKSSLSPFGIHPALLDQPTRASIVAQAKLTTMFASLPCRDPFVDAAGTNDISREPDPHDPEQLLTTKYTKVVVALDATGSVTDAWTYSPSASPDFDKSALELARKGSYKAAVSACKPVPSVLLFTVTSLQ